MLKQDPVQLDIEHLLYGLTCCINDLQAFEQHLSMEDLQQVTLSFQKLNVLIANKHHPCPFRLTAIVG